EEAKAYVTAVFLTLCASVPGISLNDFQGAAESVALARLVPYWDNAESRIALGGRLIKRSPKMFLPVVAHELGHALFKGRKVNLPRQLKFDVLDETLADIHAFILCGVLEIDYREYMKDLDYRSEFENVAADRFHTVESHEGARALLQLIVDKHNELLGGLPDWQRLLAAGTGSSTDPDNVNKALQEIVGDMLERYAGRKLPANVAQGIPAVADDGSAYRRITIPYEIDDNEIKTPVVSPDTVEGVLRSVAQALKAGVALFGVPLSGQEDGLHPASSLARLNPGDTGGLIGKLFDAAGRLVTEGITAEPKDGRVYFKKNGKPLFTADRRQAWVQPAASPAPAAEPTKELLAYPLNGEAARFAAWLDKVLFQTDRVLDEEELYAEGEKLGIPRRLAEGMAGRAKTMAALSLAFVNSLPEDDAYNVFLLRDSFALYAAARLTGRKARAMYLSKAMFGGLLRHRMSDAVIPFLFRDLRKKMGAGMDERLSPERFEEFKRLLRETLEEELTPGGREHSLPGIKEKLRAAVPALLAYLDHLDMPGYESRGLRFIDTKKTGTFPLFMETLLQLPLRELGLSGKDFYGSFDSRMVFSDLSESLSHPGATFEDSERLEASNYPVEFQAGASGIDPVTGVPSMTENPQNKAAFLFLMVALRNELLRRTGAPARGQARVQPAASPAPAVALDLGLIGRESPGLAGYIRRSGQQAVLIEDNGAVRGFSDGSVLYISRSLARDPVARLHELGEGYFAQNPEELPDGVSAHTWLRGCGKDVRRLAQRYPEKFIRPAGMKPWQFVDGLEKFLKAQLGEGRYSDSEIALIYYNTNNGRKGRELLYGLQDRIFGEAGNTLGAPAPAAAPEGVYTYEYREISVRNDASLIPRMFADGREAEFLATGYNSHIFLHPHNPGWRIYVEKNRDSRFFHRFNLAAGERGLRDMAGWQGAGGIAIPAGPVLVDFGE
ncbi:MAG: hypothetical protein ACYC5N_11535, partial [Endomicrobiales bacterium]